ncbi:hypothetical protein WJU23_20020 [Prosthecobacter sp. SYSU 5D2]|uniref:hypothetical protein n=1 Tax=Prosthecobacter sp. SYSU 5D2 TaxID=3134134 RepID=UPI0031FEF51E
MNALPFLSRLWMMVLLPALMLTTALLGAEPSPVVIDPFEAEAKTKEVLAEFNGSLEEATIITIEWEDVIIQITLPPEV